MFHVFFYIVEYTCVLVKWQHTQITFAMNKEISQGVIL